MDGHEGIRLPIMAARLGEKAGMSGAAKPSSSTHDNSRFGRKQRRREEEVGKRILALRKKMENIGEKEMEGHEKARKDRIAKLEARRDLSKIWAHVDMDAFYAAVEERDKPELRKLPMAVGKGVITTANYVARQYGVRSAMPGFQAVKLCPNIVFVTPNFEKYTAAAQQVRTVLAKYDASFISVGLDEAYLDITDCVERRRRQDEEGGEEGRMAAARAVADDIRYEVERETQLTCSVGAASNRMLAKICSDWNKPNGTYIIGPSRDLIVDFMSTLPVRKVCGIGQVTQSLLNGIGVETCGDLIEQGALLHALFTDNSFKFFMRIGLGVDETQKGEPPKEEGIRRKGISKERTFQPTNEVKKLDDIVTAIGKALANAMGESLRGRNLTLKYKTQEYDTFTRSITLPAYWGIEHTEKIVEMAKKLLQKILPLPFIRLLGLRMSGFEEGAKGGQQTLHLEEQCVIEEGNEEDATREGGENIDTSAVDGGRWCGECACYVQDFQSHMDFHLAMRLQSAEYGHNPKKRKTPLYNLSQRSLKEFFKD